MITTTRPGEPRKQLRALSLWLARAIKSDLDPIRTDPQLLRQVRVLNGLMLTAMTLCIPLGLFWINLASAHFGYVYGVAFLLWGALFLYLRRTYAIVVVGRAAVFVLFTLCTASVVLLGGIESNLLAWYMLMPLAAAVCVGKRDLWFWGVVATLTPMLIYLYPDWELVEPSPLAVEFNQQLSGIALALGGLVVSILTNIWISHHERLAQRLDESAARLKNEADAHRLLVDTAMLASAEIALNKGARTLLEHLERTAWVSAVAFWDLRRAGELDEPDYVRPSSRVFLPTPSLARSIRTGTRSVAEASHEGAQNVCVPIRDREAVVGVLEVDVSVAGGAFEESDWLLQQIVLQLGHIAERERTAQIIQHEARFDSLTSLHNRRAFHTILERETEIAHRENQKVALLFIDLNDFKRINDSLGHAAGDTVLQVVARRLQQSVRRDGRGASDESAATDTISRIGGDEFTLVLGGVRLAEDADRAAQRVLDSLASPIQINDQQFKVGASIGIAVYPDDAQRADVLVRSADAAMYTAKRRGSSGYSRYRDSDKAVDSLSFEGEMRHVIEAGQLEMHYQPVYSFQTGNPVAVEALIRWHHPEQGWISPADFIPLAEHTGLIGEVGKFQFDTALHWFSSVQASLPENFRLALNMSAAQIENSRFVVWLLGRMRASNLPMSDIELEFTETALLTDTLETKANLSALADLGLFITLDDFGTGQSSLSLLKRFPIGRIKIDRSFVNGLPDRSEDVAIVGAVLSLAQSLGIQVVAEGVEEEKQKAFLAKRGCEEMEGFLLAKPMPGDQVLSKLNELEVMNGC